MPENIHDLLLQHDLPTLPEVVAEIDSAAALKTALAQYQEAITDVIAGDFAFHNPFDFILLNTHLTAIAEFRALLLS